MKKAVKNRMLSDATMKSSVNAAYEKYISRFLSEWKKEESYRLDCYGCCEGLIMRFVKH